MDDQDVYLRVSGLRNDYLKPLGMLRDRGPLWVLRELTHGVVFTASVQLSNAARRWARDARQRRRGVERLSRDGPTEAGITAKGRSLTPEASRMLRLSAEEVEEDDLIPIDATARAKP